MTVYEMIRQRITASVPFARHTGIGIAKISDGIGETRLKQRDHNLNHVGTQHAGALFTLGEAASGAAMAGAFAPVISEIRPMASNAQIAYLATAKGEIAATGQTSKPSLELLTEFRDKGRVAFDVNVELFDEHGEIVATMTVNWHVQNITASVQETIERTSAAAN